MKKSTLLTFAIIFTLAAVLVLGVLVASLSGKVDMLGFLKNGFASATSGELIYDESFETTGIETIFVRTREQKVEFFITDDDKITVRHFDYSDAEPVTANYYDDGTSLHFECSQNIRLLSFSMVLPRLEIYVPRTFKAGVSVDVGSGSIVCKDDVNWGPTGLMTGSGSIRFEGDINCHNLGASTGSGAIRIGGEITAELRVLLQTGSGSIHVDEDIKCVLLKAESGSGTIRLDDIYTGNGGNADITTRSGSIHLGELVSSGGSNLPGGTEFNITTGSGSIKAAAIKGFGVLNTRSGSIGIDALEVISDTEISSGSGTVRVALNRVQNLKIEASTGSGSIRAGDYDFMFDAAGNGFCTIGSGERGTLSIRTGSGSIVIN